MPIFSVDSISARTLPMLDHLFKTDKDKLTTIIVQTNGVPLRRLLLASIARHTVIGYEDDPALSNTGRLLETFIKENLTRVPDAYYVDSINNVLDMVGPESEKVLLSASIARFNIIR